MEEKAVGNMRMVGVDLWRIEEKHVVLRLYDPRRDLFVWEKQCSIVGIVKYKYFMLLLQLKLR